MERSGVFFEADSKPSHGSLSEVRSVFHQNGPRQVASKASANTSSLNLIASISADEDTLGVDLHGVDCFHISSQSLNDDHVTFAHPK